MPIVRSLLWIMIAVACMGAQECKPSGDAPPFEWKPPVFAADSGTSSIIRSAGGKLDQIMCDEKRFDGFVCMPKAEVRNAQEAYFKVINQCEKWK